MGNLLITFRLCCEDGFRSNVILRWGAQFTSFVWTARLKRAGNRISMDGKGRCIDNHRGFTRTNGIDALDMSRLRQSVKYECVDPHAWETGSQAKACISHWMTFYNHCRPHSSLGGTRRPHFIDASSMQPNPTSTCRKELNSPPKLSKR
jgi:putative transposase